VDGIGETASSWRQAIEHSYAAGTDDEFVVPTAIVGEQGAGRLEDGDGVLFFNFRADRARELTRALTAATFAEFERSRSPQIELVMMTRYDGALALPVAFAPVAHEGIFADVIQREGLQSMRIAETEKYAHVTYFFNGGVEEPWPGEQRRLVPSPRVATYDLQPEMSASAVTDHIVQAFDVGRERILIANFANADMVGHTGDLEATVRAVESLDLCFARIVRAADRSGWDLWITADHGNAEQMLDPANGQPHTAHTTNPVPLIARLRGFDGRLRDGGRLADVVPTILDHWQVSKPSAMTGQSLLC